MKHQQEIIIQYQSLFNHFRNEHNLILTTSEMQEIISECKKVVCFDCRSAQIGVINELIRITGLPPSNKKGSLIRIANVSKLVNELYEIHQSKKTINPPPPLAAVIASKDFQDRLKASIEAGVQEDWCYNGEDEYRVDTFNADDATMHVTELLEEYFLDNELFNKN